jgi:hypothetical protein
MRWPMQPEPLDGKKRQAKEERHEPSDEKCESRFARVCVSRFRVGLYSPRGHALAFTTSADAHSGWFRGPLRPRPVRSPSS